MISIMIFHMPTDKCRESANNCMKNKKQGTTITIIGSMKEIDSLTYFDLLDHAYILLPIEDSTAIEMIGMELPEGYKNGSE